MNKQKLLGFLAALLLGFLVSCESGSDSRPRMNVEIKDGETRILVDEVNGNRYAVTRYFGNNYTINPIANKNE